MNTRYVNTNIYCWQWWLKVILFVNIITSHNWFPQSSNGFQSSEIALQLETRMTSRERLHRTLNHSDPGQVVVDLGSTSITGISASALVRLRMSLDLPEKTVRIHEPFQILGFVDEDVLQALGCDVMGVWPLGTMFGYNNDRWKPWQLFDGTQVSIGEGFNYSEDSNGNIYLHPNRDLSAPPREFCPKADIISIMLSAN